MLKLLLNKLVAGQNLEREEAASLLDMLLAEDVTDAQIAAALVALASKGETSEELAGFAETMRARSLRIDSRHRSFVDTCGTGGSSAKTFNVSTAAAFVVAASGVPVAKHGNVGVTSKSGSADVLRELGVKIDIDDKRVADIFDKIGICFMFAPLHHAATKRVAIVRRELGIRTIFNLLGPLTNPAGAPHQVIGVSNETACEMVARATAQLGTRKSWIVRGEDGLDEITLSGKTVIFQVSTGEDQMEVERFEIVPEDFGLRRSSLDRLRGGSVTENTAIIRSILDGTRTDEALDLVLINAAAAIYIAGAAQNPGVAVQLARRSIESGAATAKLQSFIELSNG